MPKGRQALLDLGVQAPDLVDAGSVNWNESIYGPPEGRQKPAVSFAEQAGSCRSEVGWLCLGAVCLCAVA